MNTAAMKKVVKLRQVVQLKQVMQLWRALGLRRGSGRSVRSGCVAVYVGAERRRFVIPAKFLNLPVFASLLERAEEEYGFQPAGGLALPCDSAFFRWVLEVLGRDEDRFKTLGLDVFLALYDESVAGGACKELPRGSFSPLFPKASV